MKIKIDKLNGDVLIYVILIPILTGAVWYKYSYNSAIAMLLFFGGMYCYFNWFLNIALSLKFKIFYDFKIKLIVFTFLSITIFAVSYVLYGLSFALKDLLVTAVLFLVQLYFILKL
jgi:hypothetical protein